MAQNVKPSERKGNYIPYVSIIIPIYNAKSTLAMCLESIQGLDYPRDKFEVIVIDNGSNDESVEIAKKFDVKLYHETTIQSSYAARNKGVKGAKGELLAFTDADCIVTQGWLKHLVKDWDDESIGCFAGEIMPYKPETLIEIFSDRINILRQAGTLNCAYRPYSQTANSGYRRKVFDKIGLFNAELVSGGDADISWRMQRETSLKIKFIPEALVYHKHRTSFRGLYKQFRRYEHGKLLWQKYYPDYKLPSVEQRRTEFIKAVKRAVKTLPGNLKKYLKKQADLVDILSPFLRVVMAYGTLSARR